MKKNNKGFMLIEVIITSTIVVTTLIAFYANFEKLYKKYNEANNYHDIDGLYATKEVINYFLTNNDLDFNEYLADTFYTNHYKFIIKDSIDQLNNDNIRNIKDLYNIKNMIITEYNVCNLDSNKPSCNSEEESIRNNNINETFKEYLEYIIRYYDLDSENINSTKYDYLVITERETEDGKTYYSSIGI